jgi:ubiquinone/menaquinone biosynthesis C-methylase UbiE
VSVKGESGIEVDLRAGNAQDLPFTDAHFDAVVAMLALCTIPDDQLGRSRGSEGL